MKAAGPHREKILTAVTVRNTNTPGLYPDGNGLYLRVGPTGNKSWIQRLVVQGRRRDLGLGSVSLVSLAQARQKATENRRIARDGGDPALKPRAVPSFQEAAQEVHGLYRPTWTNAKQAAQWLTTLKTYAFPVLGGKPVDTITTADVLAVLKPIWTTKHETATRVRQRMGTVFKWCVGQGWITENPAGEIQASLPRIKKSVRHFPALPYRDVPKAIETVRGSEAGIPTKLALEFLVLTAARSGEVRLATWGEMDRLEKVWTIPPTRMKKRKVHRVPLSPRALAILEEAAELDDGSGYVFIGSKTGRPISDNTLTKLLRELGIPCVPHGFRSSFRQWAAEETNLPREVAEFALAHVVGDAAERAYQRSDLFEKRRKLMGAWASYLQANRGTVTRIDSRPATS